MTVPVRTHSDDLPVPSDGADRQSGNQHSPILFIIAADDTDTSLLCQFLNNHPDLAIVPETQFIPDLMRACQRSTQPAERFVEYLTQHPRWPDFQIDTEMVREAITSLNPFTVSDGLRAFYRLYAACFGKSRIGDGTAAYGPSAEQIQLLLPEARFIHVLGDMPGLVRKRLTRSGSLMEAADHWVAQVRAIQRQASELQHYLELRYETLIAEPEAMLRQMCEFLSLTWDPVLLQHYEQVTSQLASVRQPSDRMYVAGKQRRANHRRMKRLRRVRQLNNQRRTLPPDHPAMVEPVSSKSGAARETAPQRIAVCITGMHRSGTSLVGQILYHGGVYLGPYRQLAVSTADNLDGYWEHPDFHQLNEDVLAHFGGGWDVAPPMPAGWSDLSELEPLRQRALALMHQFDNQRFWGWKDPRSSLTIPFWAKLIPGLKVVICVRNPLDVAQSLSRRGMSSRAFGMQLWRTYYERLLASVAPQDRIITHYETYFVDPVAETKRVLAWLNIPSSPALIERACRVASEELRHHHNTTTNLLATEAPIAVLELYAQLCNEAHTADSAVLVSTLAELAADNSDGQLARLAARLVAAIARLREQEIALAELRPALTRLQTEVAILQYMLQARDAEVGTLRPILAAREAEISGFTGELEVAREILAARETEISGFTGELEMARELLAAREAEISGLTRELGMAREILAAREAEISGFTGELEVAREILAAREAEIASLTNEREMRHELQNTLDSV